MIFNNRISIPVFNTFLIFLIISCSFSNRQTSLKLPDPLIPPANQKLALSVQGIGVQIYKCIIKTNDPNQFEWSFIGPEADLYLNGNRVGKHYSGPTWEAYDGSKVIGEIKVRYIGPETNAIPWLLLTTKSNEGDGIFSKIKSIQRIQTVGGKQPKEGCERITLGQERRINYKAIYNFYVVTK